VKLLFDQNLSRRLVDRLASEFPGSAHVVDVGLESSSDEQIWSYAGAEDYVVVSKDSDFRQLAFLHGPPPKIVWLRVGNVSTDVIQVLLADSVEALDAFGQSDAEALMIIESGGSSIV